MVVEQAVFGEEHGGHALLNKSMVDTSTLASLVWRTDLPGAAPSGVAWNPFLSGFPHGQYYVLQRSFPDISASRGGMVLTHALLVPIEDISEVPDLRCLTAKLMQINDSRSAALEPIMLEITKDQRALQTSNELPYGTLAMANALVSAVKSPVVWVGQKGFEEAVFSVWVRLWPAMRRNFSFRLSFSPQDCQDLPPTVVSTPSPLKSRWSGYTLIDLTEKGPDVDASNLLLETSLAADLKMFADEISAKVNSFQDLQLIDSCRKYRNLTDPTADERLAFVRLLGRLSAAPDSGASIKARAIKQLTAAIRAMDSTEIGSLRNLDLSAFSQRDAIWDAIAEWMERHAVSSASSDEKLRRMLQLAVSTQSRWSGALLEGFDKAANNKNDGLGANLWSWWLADQSLVDGLFPRLPADASMEGVLLRTSAENIPVTVATLLIGHSALRKWIRLHGMVVGKIYDANHAIDLQLQVDQGPQYLDGLRLAVQAASSEDLILATIARKEPRLVNLSAERIANRPSLCAGFDAQDSTWLELLVAASKSNPEIWKALPKGRSLMYELLDNILAGAKNVHTALLSYLATTPLADIVAYPRRSEVWQKLPKEVAPSILTATAEGWRREILKDTNFNLGVEPTLEAIVLREPEVSRFLRERIPNQLATAISLFSRFTSLSERQFDQWLVAVLREVHSLDVYDSVSIGQLVSKRKWQSVALRLSNDLKNYGRRDLRPALRECKNLLSFRERWGLYRAGSLDASQISSEEQWEALTHAVLDLYPSGPRENKIWSRSGGTESVLHVGGTGGSQWQEAIRLLRLGGGGQITGAMLLREMAKDFSGNEQLQWLLRQSEFAR